MSQPLEGLQADREALLGICGSLSAGTWDAPSGCAGWTVKDLVSHLAALYWVVVDPSTLPDTSALPTEEAQEVYVRSRRSRNTEEVLSDYESVTAKAIDALAGFVDADFEIPLGDLGTYPASAIPAAFCFDHYTHIRSDLFAPRGPLRGEPPASDAVRLEPALDWIEAALPQQNKEVIASIERPVDLVVAGTAARTVRVGPPGAAAATVQSDTPGLVRWITQRARWDDVGAQASGDEDTLALLRGLRVF